MKEANMLHSVRRTAAAICVVLMASTIRVAAQGNEKPVITSASVSFDQTTLFVEGEYFTSRPVVALGNVVLNGVAVDAANRHMPALLPALPAGTYLLQV